ncbi:hypothetical protein VspSTUT16_01680 [Vibrio sp. STUT-A16]|nr:hypothetical protein VspSTUT16_01680 [Vibrio sp. STUT-A16]
MKPLPNGEVFLFSCLKTARKARKARKDIGCKDGWWFPFLWRIWEPYLSSRGTATFRKGG